MRRGNTLIEMVVSLSILAVVVSVCVRMLFVMDWAVGSEDRELTETAGGAQLLEDLGVDVRAARGVIATGSELRLAGATDVRYYWDAQQEATVRQATAPRRETTAYSHLRASFRRAGALVHVRIRGAELDVRTAYYVRNR